MPASSSSAGCSGGGDTAIENGRVTVRAPDKVSKFVSSLHQLFNARARCNRVEKITRVAERAVFMRDAEGLLPTEIAPGIDVERGVLA